MGQYRYHSFKGDGHSETGVIEASSESLALSILEAQGLTVTELAPEVDKIKRSGELSGRRRIPLSVQAESAEQLALFLGAGFSTVQATRSIATSTSHRGLHAAFSRVATLLEEGHRLEAAFSAVELEFEPIFGALLRTTNANAKDGEILRSLGRSLRASDRRSANIRGALTYPAILFAGGISLTIFIAKALAPELVKIFTSAGRDPPAFLSALARLGQSSEIFYGLLVCIALVAIFQMNRSIRAASKTFILWAIPPLGTLVATFLWARAMATLNLMLAAGFPLVAALRAASRSAEASVVGVIMSGCADHVEAGGKMQSFLATQTSIPSSVRDLLSIGEETNTLVQVSGVAAETLDASATRGTEETMRLLPPIMTLLVGSMVGLLVYLTMDALLSLNDLAF